MWEVVTVNFTFYSVGFRNNWKHSLDAITSKALLLLLWGGAQCMFSCKKDACVCACVHMYWKDMYGKKL